jgi:hypothetical protein
MENGGKKVKTEISFIEIELTTLLQILIEKFLGILLASS